MKLQNNRYRSLRSIKVLRQHEISMKRRKLAQWENNCIYILRIKINIW